MRQHTEAGMGAKRASGAVAGALVAGLGLSVVMLLGEKLGGKPSELIELERDTAAKLDIDTRRGDAPATTTEQLVTHAGHLALSALAGIAYAAVVDETFDGAAAGAVFGVGFYISTYGLTGPLLGVTPRPWRDQPLRAIQHPVVHMAFGIAAALSARRAARA